MSVTTIIPAYNEEKYIESVLKAAQNVEIIDRIIVVSDGSTDRTSQIASMAGAEVLELKDNLGKGGAIKAGLNRCEDDIILLLDADLIGLKDEHILSLLEPVINNEADMSIGVFRNGRTVTDLAQKIAPYLSGQRAVRKTIIDRMKGMDTMRYGVDVAITKFLKSSHGRIKTVELSGVTHCMKEEKLGVLKGFNARMKMYWEILKFMTLSKG